MEKDLKLLEIYSKMGIAIPKQAFVSSFTKIIRFGTNDDIKYAHQILTDLAEKEETKGFAEAGLRKYKEITLSKVYFSRIQTQIKNWHEAPPKDSQQLVPDVVFYNRIQDSFFLEEANKLLIPFLESHPQFAHCFQIRKTKKELEREKEENHQEKDQVSLYQTEFNNFFNSFRPYIINGIFSNEKNDMYEQQLRRLELMANNLKDSLGDQYQECVATLHNARDQIEQINESLKEEAILWQY